MTRRILRDDQWKRIEEMLPGKSSDPEQTAADNRLFVEAVLWVARTGSPWRDLPEAFGPWNSVYKRFARWSNRGVWQRMFGTLAMDADFEEIFVDSTIVRAHQHAAGAAKKTGSRPSVARAVVEGLGHLARCTLTAGQTHDVTQAQALIEGIATQAIVADKAYDGDLLIEFITQRGASAVIPSRENRLRLRPFDAYHYKHRNLIERFFCRIKHFRRIATRYDKLVSRFSSFIALVAACVWLA